MQAKQPRSDRLYMTTLDTGRCSHHVMSSTKKLPNAFRDMFEAYDAVVFGIRYHDIHLLKNNTCRHKPCSRLRLSTGW